MVFVFANYGFPLSVLRGSRSNRWGPRSQVIAACQAGLRTGGLQCNGVHTFDGALYDFTNIRNGFPEWTL
jgi:hypothetical protein